MDINFSMDTVAPFIDPKEKTIVTKLVKLIGRDSIRPAGTWLESELTKEELELIRDSEAGKLDPYQAFDEMSKEEQRTRTNFLTALMHEWYKIAQAINLLGTLTVTDENGVLLNGKPIDFYTVMIVFNWFNYIKPDDQQEPTTATPATEEPPPQAPSTGAHRARKIDYPLDKPNSVIWGLLKENTHGQVSFPIKAEPAGSKKKINIIYSIDFDGLEETGLKISRKLTQFDKRVYIAVDALWSAGNTVITISQIYRTMGYTGTPGKADREKINTSLTKMRGAIITLDNSQETTAGLKYPEFVYDGALLPFERIKHQDVINGQIIEASIHPLREPPLIEFARGREQITTISPILLQDPLSKTETNLAIGDYLLERIAHAKSGRQPKKILLSTLYKKANITTAKQRNRAPEKVKKLLDYYIECDHIKGYTMDTTSITLEL